ncbi:hypothetical protein [Erythrobacter sp. JK5]|uniref:hypothetical protein n=1 Tax=Erythrobacter sp. JK5 TaxID=2829500 RepID=UPI001BAB68E1|nr:hypothetical protein [Erythrobacter sp. JK5]QUL38036.1 hypothetical protein KDC96_00980 [Erythrobacter sp. JK5]
MARLTSFLAFGSLLASSCTHSTGPEANLAPPEDNIAGQLYRNIWSDLQSNALIGNGNELAMRWANATNDREEARQLHINDLLCGGGETLLRCQFELLRDGGVAFYLGDPVPDRLACEADFRRSGPEDQWSIPRLPPGPNGGHTRITINCRALD